MSEQPFMKFEIREKVSQLKENNSFYQLASLELQPIVKVYESEHNIEISGYLVLNGEFVKDEVDDEWEEQYEQSDGVHSGSIFDQTDEPLNFQYQIPISIQIQADRVKEPSEIFIDIDFFDYEILSDNEMELIAHVKLLGVHPYKQQDTPVDLSLNAEGLMVEESSSDSSSNEQAYQEGSANISNDPEKNEQSTMQNMAETASEQGDVEEVKQMKDNEKKEEDVEQVEAKEGQQKEVEQVEAKEEQQEAIDTMEELETEEIVALKETNLEPVDQNQSLIEESKDSSEQLAPKMKIGFKKKENAPKQNEFIGSNPLYSLIKKEKQESMSEDNSENTIEQPLSMEIDESPTDVAFNSNEKKEPIEESVKIVEEVIREKPVQEGETERIEETQVKEREEEQTKQRSKSLLYSLLQGNEESRTTMKLYFVQKNDTLQSIAEKYQIKVQTIVEKNHLSIQEIHEGQILYLPIGR
ncbi:LysM peptidoglycan-binding domain-containing protein [Tepidibacillus fermentans]|uniref:LysM peptidoglycan-binding domain-containing protein n=1 Tax=Tepidibacillus fermentans TaxID=1281767 RepID=UPI00140521DB|nr:LysM peptidoglycan-binding domain-containing protein [Tepidibacillus fermentans]